MECPTCHKEMELLRQDTSHSKKQEKNYDRATYSCQQDDVWVTVEVPQKNATEESLPVATA